MFRICDANNLYHGKGTEDREQKVVPDRKIGRYETKYPSKRIVIAAGGGN